MKNKYDDFFSQLNLFFGNLFRNTTKKVHYQFFRYIIVGGLAFLVDLASLFVLTDIFSMYYLISASIAFILGLLVNYYLSIKWVFNQRNLSNKWLEFQIFAFIGVIGLFFNDVLIWVFTDYIGIYYLFSKIITAFLVLIWNFVARKFILFKS